MTLDDMWPMTEAMERLHGEGWGGYFKDEGTTSYITQAFSEDDRQCYVVLGCLDGQWGAEACEPDGSLIGAGYGDTPQEALDNLF